MRFPFAAAALIALAAPGSAQTTTTQTLPAYLITEFEPGDQNALQQFSATMNPVVASHGGVYLSRRAKVTSILGNAPRAVTVIQFPSADDAMKYAQSDGFKAALELRNKGQKEARTFIIGGGDQLAPK